MTQDTLNPGQATLPTPQSTASFWHSQPSKILLGHRTTEDLPTKADVVIIGSGIAGAFAAHYLAEGNHEKNLDVVMVEAREACWGATGRNGGHCQPKIYTTPPHIARFELANYEIIRSLVMENGIECDWRDVTSCHGYTSPSMFAQEVTVVSKLRTVDPELGDMLNIVGPDSINPSLTDLGLKRSIIGAITQKTSGSLWPYKLVCWILERILSSSAAGRKRREKHNFSLNLQTTTPVIRLQQLEKNWIVHTPRGMLAAKKVLLATNAYTSHLLPEFSDLIVPVRGEMSSLIPPAALCPRVGKPLVGIASYGFYGHERRCLSQDDYLIQRPFDLTKENHPVGGELMFGGGRGYAANLGVGVSDDSDIDQPAADYLRMDLNNDLEIGNDGAELEASYEWSGIMGYSGDGRPWVGEVPPTLGGGNNLWICAGFTGHGMANASLCAKAVVKLMMGRTITDFDLPREFHVSAERANLARKTPILDLLKNGTQRW